MMSEPHLCESVLQHSRHGNIIKHLSEDLCVCVCVCVCGPVCEVITLGLSDALSSVIKWVCINDMGFSWARVLIGLVPCFNWTREKPPGFKNRIPCKRHVNHVLGRPPMSEKYMPKSNLC